MKRMNEDEFLKDISSSLADQVNEELEYEDRERKRKMEGQRKKKKKKGLALKIVLGIVTLFIASGAFLTLTPMGRKILTRLAVEYMYSKLDVKQKKQKPKKEGTDTGQVEEHEEELVKGAITENIDLSEMSDTFKNAAHEDGVYNILLLGVEAMFEGGKSGGRTDSIMIATINTKKKTLGLTSLMRDTYVRIPGFKDNRINAAYALGGEKLMFETIAENYGIRLDGSAIVGFDSFQQVIDDLGGVEIELTATEAKYLNTTNYISERKNRNMKPGINLMNGNQALGYARIRKRATLDGSNNDEGRTSRHRRIIMAIFNKMKRSNPATLIRVMNTVLPKIKTDVDKDNATSYLAELLELSIDGVPLDTLRLPEDEFKNPTYVNKAAVVVVTDWEKTKENLKTFLFEERKPKEEVGTQNVTPQKKNP